MVLKKDCTRNGIKGDRKVYNQYGVYLVIKNVKAFLLFKNLLFIKYYFQNLFIIYFY